MNTSVEPSAVLPEIKDQAAITEVLRVNREMFEVLVRRYNQRLFRIGIAYLRSREHVEDCMQNTYLKAFTHLNQFNEVSAFSTWLTRIMINECLIVLRQRKSRPEPDADPLESDRLSSNDEQAERKLSLLEMRTLLEKHIADLPASYRVVYVMREIEQLDTSETAAALQLSQEAVRVRLHRARELLKERLLASAEGVELFTFGTSDCHRLTALVMVAILHTS